jgi:rod shape-determining protein MreD
MPAGRVLFAVVLLVVALAVQVSVLARLPLPGATPDLVLLAVVALALAHGPGFGLVAGFAAGLGSDLVPPADHAVGRWALVLTLARHLACGDRDPAHGGPLRRGAERVRRARCVAARRSLRT